MLTPAEIVFCAEKNLEAYKHTRPWCFIENGTLFVIIKGTHGEDDIVKDLRANLVRQDPWRVHGGFKAVYDEINHVVQMSTLLSGIKRVVVSGHSLGAAVALPIAYKLKECLSAYGVEIEVITFANPRYGNARFVKDFNAAFPDAVWIQYGHDIIPHLPSTWFNWNKVFGYHHHAGRRWLNDDGSDVTLKHGLLKWLKYWIRWRPKDLTNHRMPTYIAACKAAAPRWQKAIEEADTHMFPVLKSK